VLVGKYDATDERTSSPHRLVDECRIDLGEAQLRAAEVLEVAVGATPVPAEPEMAIVAVPADERTAEIVAAVDVANGDLNRPLGVRSVTRYELDCRVPPLKPDMDILVPAATRTRTAAAPGGSTPCSSTRSNLRALTFGTCTSAISLCG
jgi:hypothetical protein